ncbi:hypothetical protein [Dokdonella sp.]|uniref:hypothetical protein n=1 Tax=Dokdonella sp. TaxID=2291710 RepID=UPI001B015005|nr:hypothetical protein [Dokdonella sp.]MBO9664084.1 tetratricopeptide repeat protein [Dokdonella sp.]
MRMIAVILLAATLSFSALAKSTASRSSSPLLAEEEDTVRQAIRRAYYLIQANDLPGAAAIIDEATRSPAFANSPAEQRYAATFLAGAIALDRGETETAHRWFVLATEFKQSDSKDWHSRLRTAYDLKDYDDSARCVTQIAKRWPKTLVEIRAQAIFRIGVQLNEERKDDAYRNMLESLFDAGWTGNDADPDGLWADLARLLLARDDVRKAKQVASHVHLPLEVVALRADRRFDRITRKDPEAFQIARAIDFTLKATEAAVRTSPDRLQPLMRLQSRLFQSAQFERAISIADDVIAKAAADGGSKVYEDFDEYYAWILDQRAEALARLGRWDEALKQREKAARRPESGQMNVSQVINLGELYNTLGRPQDALDTITEVGAMSPYGRMQLEMIRLDASMQRNDAQAVANHLAFMREHRTDAIATWQMALVITDDLQGAANLLLERLRREDWRNQALVDIQDYMELPSTPILSKRRLQWKALLARPEVRSAIENVGRVERYEIPGPRS